MKIGLFGGSFNPPHFGHLQIAKIAIKKLRLNQLWWLTTSNNPLKNQLNNYNNRLIESKKLIKNYPQIKLKNINYQYSYNLVKKLKNAYPNYQFIWIMGADNLENFHRWYKFKELAKMLEFAVFARGEHFLKSPNYKICKIMKNNPKIKFKFYHIKKINISSTEIRNKNV
ncbi:MAG: nicotinate (nicotinamide) nucleotide adenylyltransferase [Rickettsiales bacterium]